MRVLHVITDTDRRGAQVFAQQLVERLSNDAEDTHRLVALSKGTRSSPLAVPVLGASRFDARTLRGLRTHMRRSDVVVAHGSSTLPACTIAGLGLSARVIYRSIGDPSFWLSTPCRRRRVGMMLRRADHVVTLWPGSAEFLQDAAGLAASRLHVIPNGVPAEEFNPPSVEQQTEARASFGIPSGATVLLCPGALEPAKHPDKAIRALAHLPDGYHLLLIGDGPMRADVELLGRDIDGGRVVVAGQIPDPQRAYWAADVVVLPSETEGLPGVLIEAGLCGRPSVAAAVGGNASIVLDGETGAVVAPADPRALAAGVLRVVTRPESGGRARRHCLLTFSMDGVAHSWASLLLHATSHRGALPISLRGKDPR